MPPRGAETPRPSFALFTPALSALASLVTDTLCDAPLPEACRAFLTNGKWLRPRFLFASATLARNAPSGPAVVQAAAAIEMVHAACLLHDDIVDRCSERRGIPALHMTQGSRATVLTGTHLVHLALELVAGLPAFARRRMAEVAQLVARSELTEIARTFDITIGVDERLAIMEEKTASVFSLACELGGFLVGRGAPQRTHLRQCGTAFGMLYQIADDLDDLFGSDLEVGRLPGTDLREGVISLPLVYGLASPFRTALIAALEAGRTGEDPVAALARTRLLLQGSGALEQVAATSLRYTNGARLHLRALPRSRGTRWMESTLNETMSRIEDRLERARALPPTGCKRTHA